MCIRGDRPPGLHAERDVLLWVSQMEKEINLHGASYRAAESRGEPPRGGFYSQSRITIHY